MRPESHLFDRLGTVEGPTRAERELGLRMLATEALPLQNGLSTIVRPVLPHPRWPDYSSQQKLGQA